jgi:hypothetical protein
VPAATPLETGAREELGNMHKAKQVRARFEVFTAVTMKNVVFWDIKHQFVPQRRHITSSLQSPASSCYVRFSGFHGGDYEECRLLRYKTPVLTSQETHHVSATESSQFSYVRF